MNVLWAGAITAGAAIVAVAAMLLVRRRAPEGGFFADGDRAAGFFGVLAAGFAILLGFIVFLAFANYDESRSGAEVEALIVGQQYETAQFFPVAPSRRLSDQLVCYGRSVVHQEWPRMEAGTQGDTINPWAVAQFRVLKSTRPANGPEQSAYDKWLDQTSGREEARSARIHGAEGVIPGPLWIVLFFSAAAIFVFMLFFADSEERAVVQGMMVGTVVSVIVATLIAIRFLDEPFRGGYGGLEPVAMERTLSILEQQREVVRRLGPLPCDGEGRAA
jgi:Protein of unknown function (DUF4239)